MTDTTRDPPFTALEKAVADLGDFITVRQDGKGDFTSIQAAIDAAPPNSLVEIQDEGIYNEKVQIDETHGDLTLRGARECWPIITSAGPVTDFPKLIHSAAPHLVLERLVLPHHGGAGDAIACVSAPRVEMNKCILDGWCTMRVADVTLTDCVLIGHLYVNGRIVANNVVWPVFLSTSGGRHAAFTNNLFFGQTIVGIPCEFRNCTFANTLIVGSGPAKMVDCIARSIEAAKPDVSIEFCAFYTLRPYINAAREGKNCRVVPQPFVNAKLLDYRLLPISTCRNAASDGGDLGFRYVPEIIEVLNRAFLLRERGIVKF